MIFRYFFIVNWLFLSKITKIEQFDFAILYNVFYTEYNLGIKYLVVPDRAFLRNYANIELNHYILPVVGQVNPTFRAANFLGVMRY
ncbi:hypothetical protein AM228_05955 [Planktothricoides sp. SR001]|nr:hypothetical protein AM228_05955 [Planktothricoides sp. SR001]